MKQYIQPKIDNIECIALKSICEGTGTPEKGPDTGGDGSGSGNSPARSLYV